jgi:hypothetical protein
MSKQHNAHGHHLCLLAGAALISALVCNADDGWAKHKKAPKQTGLTDPCATPTAFIKDRVEKMRVLQPPADAAEPNNVAAWIEQLQGKKRLDPDKAAKISDLRSDADSVNNMLRAGGCKTIDIDEELKKPSTSTGSASPRKR